jgi:hypothetical protein
MWFEPPAHKMIDHILLRLGERRGIAHEFEERIALRGLGGSVC